MTYAPVAQLDRAPDFESVGRRFESCRAYHSKMKGLVHFKDRSFFSIDPMDAHPSRKRQSSLARTGCVRHPGSRSYWPTTTRTPTVLDVMLECRNISFRYPGAEKYVFENLSFRMETPGFYALFGPSGVGKTSLAKILAGDITDFLGEVRAGESAKLLYTYNLERLPGWSSVGNHIDKITPLSRKVRKNELAASFGLESLLGLRFTQLSLGQKNRVNLLRYLLQDFRFLIMDESLANVDEKTREQILFKIKDTFPESYFLYISHNVVEVSKFCKEIFVLRGSSERPLADPIEGLDLMSDRHPDQKVLELAMLEIMNAS